MSYKNVPLAKALTFIRGITFKPDDKVEPFSEDSVACMRTKNIQKLLDDSDILAVPSEFVKRDEQILEQGDLLISSANSWELVGKVVRVPKLDYKATAGGFISILRPNREVVDPDYLYRFISLDDTQHNIRHLGRQTTNISNLDRKRFLELEIPLPPLAVQKQIAAVLEKADTLRSQCQQMEQELNALAQSVFLDMFGDPVKNPKGWPVIPVKNFLKVTTGNTPSKAKDEYYSDNYIEWAKSDNINTPSDYLTKASVYLSDAGKKVGRSVSSGSILVTCIAGSPSCIGNAAITDREVAFNQQINAVTPIEGESLTEFVYMSFVVGKVLIQRASTNSMKGMVSKGNFEQIEFPLPPISLQRKYCQIFKEISLQKEDAAKYRAFHEDLFNSLIQRAFKGELELKGVA